MNRMARVLIVAAVCAWCLSIGAVTAQDARRLTPEQLKALVITQQPETRVAKVDQERLVVRRLDVVDEAGVIRMVLASPTPQPILDGIQYKRMFPVSGVTFFDAQGSERGGIGVADIEGSAVITAQDHANADAIGWRVMPDGAVSFHINERPALIREKALGDRLIPGVQAATRIAVEVASDGTPAIALADKQNRPRIKLTVTDEGYGAIQFLDANGKVIEEIAPERKP